MLGHFKFYQFLDPSSNFPFTMSHSSYPEQEISGRCDRSQGGVKVFRNLFQLMERYDGHGGDVRECGKV